MCVGNGRHFERCTQVSRGNGKVEERNMYNSVDSKEVEVSEGRKDIHKRGDG